MGRGWRGQDISWWVFTSGLDEDREASSARVCTYIWMSCTCVYVHPDGNNCASVRTYILMAVTVHLIISNTQVANLPNSNMYVYIERCTNLNKPSDHTDCRKHVRTNYPNGNAKQYGTCSFHPNGRCNAIPTIRQVHHNLTNTHISAGARDPNPCADLLICCFHYFWRVCLADTAIPGELIDILLRAHEERHDVI